MEVAVLGGGLAGCSAALALADRGVRVELIERAPALMGAASLHNEGKLHLGYVYAADPDARTHRLMALGSLSFLAILERLAGVDPRVVRRSTPFVYGVPADSQLTIESIQAHFDKVDATVECLLGQQERVVQPAEWHPSRRMREREFSELLNPSVMRAAIATTEYAVDTSQLADQVSTAVRRHPKVVVRSSTSVLGAEATNNGDYALSLREAQQVVRRRYVAVVNCLWSDRLKIDASLGITNSRPWLMRYKAAITVRRRNGRRSLLPSATFVLGPYGDVVTYDCGKVYLSWYPTCKLGESKSLDCDNLFSVAAAVDREELIRNSIHGLSGFVPALSALKHEAESIEVGGGIIFAWGHTDITDPSSGLHQRFDIGPVVHGRWISVDTGKYCLAPYFGQQASDILCDLLQVNCENDFVPYTPA